jgi:nucleotide-binding universal stress UspA family protein
MSNEQSLSKILVPMDGSEPSFHAAIIANNIAKKFNSEIIVLYVVVSPSSYEYANLTGLVTPKQIDMIIQNAKDEAKDWFNKVENIVREGNPNAKLTMKILVTEIALYGEIIQYAEQENIDLIVIGTRGRSGMKKLLLGSTASGILKNATCPVLVTK